jgi:hypothetical protein
VSLGYLARLSAGGAFDQSVQLNPTAKAIADAGTGLVNVAPELTRLAAQAQQDCWPAPPPAVRVPNTWADFVTPKTVGIGVGVLVLILLLRRR